MAMNFSKVQHVDIDAEERERKKAAQEAQKSQSDAIGQAVGGIAGAMEDKGDGKEKGEEGKVAMASKQTKRQKAMGGYGKSMTA